MMTIPEEKPKKMVVYAHDYCGQAKSLAYVLEKHNIDHEWRDVLRGEPAWKEELKRLARGNLSVPTVVFPDGTVMVEPWPEEVLEHLGLKAPSLKDKLAGWFQRDEEGA